MGYLNEHGLARYDGLLKNWVTFKSGTVDGIDPLLNWQKTSTAGAVTCYPLPAASIDPVVNFMFTETGPAEGTKGPDNPSTITGVTQAKVTRCGKNILKTPYYSGSVASSTVTITPATDGTLTITKIASSSNIWYNFNDNNIGTRFSAGTTFILSGTHTGGTITVEGWAIWVFEADGSVLFSQSLSSTPGSFTLDHDAFLVFRLFLNKNHVCSDVVLKPQIEIGSTATTFEPYEGADYTVNLGGTYYGGSVDLSAGTMTVTHVIRTVDGTNVKFVDGGETTNYYRLYFSIVYSQPAADRVLDTKCTFIDTAYFGFNTDSEHYYVGTDRVYVFLDKTLPFLSGSGTVVEKANAYATQMVQGGTPWLVTYKLATPYTAQLTPTQILSLAQIDPYTPRINTVYSDQQSVQVGYPKSPQATSTELTNAIISLGGEI